MIQMLNKRRNRAEDSGEEGFTLIELMVVVLIIGILLAIAVPTFLSAQKNAKSKAATSNVRSALSAAKTVYADKQSYGTDFDLSALRAAEPSLKWLATGTGSAQPNEIAWSTATNDTLYLAVKSKLNDCFYIKDSVKVDGTGGTFFKKTEGVGTATCASADAATATSISPADASW